MIEGISYDDVLIVPKYTEIMSRRDISTRTKLTRNIDINIPIISSNMDSVTESKMAIAMAENGGIGMIHRFMPIEKQVEKIRTVKRAESFIIEKPHTLSINSILKDAKNIMAEHGPAGIIILDEDKKVTGILTKRDTIFEKDVNKKISELMTSFKDLVYGSPNISMDDATELLRKNKVEKLPLIDDKGYLRGLISSRDIRKREAHKLASKDKKGRLLVAGAVGVVGDYLERTEALVVAECDLINVDVAHAHAAYCINAVKAIRKRFPEIPLSVGTIATKKAAKDLQKLDIDALRVGVGPGSICVTRIVTGCGVPQITALREVAKVAKVPIIADGGIKNSGDIVKALVAGADTVVLGNLLAGTEEAPGNNIFRKGRKYKMYRGSTSILGSADRKERETGYISEEEVSSIVPEGVEGMVPYKGNVKEILHQLVMGIKSGMSYCGAKEVKDLRKGVEFIKISPSGMRESSSHDINEF